MASIELEALSKTYSGRHAAVNAVTLTIRDGELLVLVGPSGCGKSTLLRLIAGLETPDAGRIVIEGRDATDVPAQSRDLAMVFQNYALYPHMTVRANLGYGLLVRRAPRVLIEARVTDVARALDLEAVLDRRPAQLSGGQRQRVALGRAMVREPKAFLLDEPLSNLDPALRSQARAELLRLHRALHATMIYVTHDQEEALTLGTRVAVMRDGRLEQVAPPLELYARAANTFVAGFIGSPPMNVLLAPLPGLQAPAGTLVGIRPHDVRLGLASSGPIVAIVEIVEPRGYDAIVTLRAQLPAGPASVVAVVVTQDPPPVGTDVALTFPSDRTHIFDAKTGNRISDPQMSAP